MKTISRRRFLEHGGRALGGATILLATRGTARAYPLDGIMGVQSYELRPLLASDLNGTLKELSGYGYKALDYVVNAGPGQPPAKEMRQALDAAGMVCHNAHLPLSFFEDAAYAQTIALARDLGIKSAVCQASVRGGTADDWKKVAGTLNTHGEKFKRDGFQLGFHNHGEFQPMDGTTAFDILVQNTDPALVKFQFDVGNAAQAGADPLAYLTRYPNRYYSMHVKDVKDGRIGVAVGEGTLDFAKLFAAARAAGIHNYDVETGARPDVVMAKLKQSAEYLRDVK
jgi:sugar phosphate isomerase/epimerase